MTLELAPTDFGGFGPTLVVAPSLGATVATLQGPAVQHLTNRHRILGWDLPGERDPVTTVENLRTIAERVRRGRLEVIADAAHQAVAERPEQVAALIP